MKLSRNAKQNGGTGIIAILTMVAHLLLSIFGGAELEYADSIEVDMLRQDVVSMLEATGKDIVPVVITMAGIIYHSDELPLQGGVDLDARIGDVLIFRKEDNHWAEANRSLSLAD